MIVRAHASACQRAYAHVHSRARAHAQWQRSEVRQRKQITRRARCPAHHRRHKFRRKRGAGPPLALRIARQPPRSPAPNTRALSAAVRILCCSAFASASCLAIDSDSSRASAGRSGDSGDVLTHSTAYGRALGACAAHPPSRGRLVQDRSGPQQRRRESERPRLKPQGLQKRPIRCDAGPRRVFTAIVALVRPSGPREARVRSRRAPAPTCQRVQQPGGDVSAGPQLAGEVLGARLEGALQHLHLAALLDADLAGVSVDVYRVSCGCM
jgi:hypothetical protein